MQEHDHNHIHSHNPHKKDNESDKDSDVKRLIKTAGICSFFIIVELLGGYFANSVAIISDAAHLFSDLISFGLSILSLYIAKKAPDAKYSFGYHRAEILGAMTSTIIIWILTLFLLQEAYERLINPHTIDANIMLITAVIGLFCNMVMISILHSDPNGHHNCSHSHGNSCSSGGKGKNEGKKNKKNLKKNFEKNDYLEINEKTGINSKSSSGEEMLDSSNICFEKGNDSMNNINNINDSNSENNSNANYEYDKI